MTSVKTLLRMLIFSSAVAANAETVAGSFMVPYIDISQAFFATGLSYSGGGLVQAARFDLFATGGGPGSFSLTMARLNPNRFSFRATFLSLPAFNESLPIPGLILSHLSTGYANEWNSINFNLSFHNAFIPEIVTVFKDQPISVTSDPVFAVAAGVGFHDFRLQAAFAAGADRGYLGSTAVGKATLSAWFAAAAWKDFGLFFLSIDSSLAAAAYALFSGSVGYSITAAGSAAIKAAGGWGSLLYVIGPVSLSLHSGFILYWTPNTVWEAEFTENSQKQNWIANVDADCAPALVARATIDWHLDSRWTLSVERSFAYLPVPPYRVAMDGGTIITGTVKPALTDWLASLDPVTVLLAGVGITVKRNFP